MNQEHTNPLQATVNTHTHSSTLRSFQFLVMLIYLPIGENRTNPQTLGKHVKLHTDCNPSSGSNKSPWSYEAAVLPATPLCISEIIKKSYQPGNVFFSLNVLLQFTVEAFDNNVIMKIVLSTNPGIIMAYLFCSFLTALAAGWVSSVRSCVV